MLAPLLFLIACSTPDPVPAEPVPTAESPKQQNPGGGAPGKRSVADAPIPPGAKQMPEELVCRGFRGGWGCFRQMPGGRFSIGAQATDPNAPGYDARATPEEGPVHNVVLSPYWIQAYPTSASEFRRCVLAGVCKVEDAITDGPFTTYGVRGEGSLPIVGITWDGAQTYCSWLGARLPTESEWEATARGAEGRTFSWGEKVICPTEEAPEVAANAGIPPGVKVLEACGTLLEGLGKRLTPTEQRGVGDALTAMPEAEAVALCKAVVELPFDQRADRLRAEVKPSSQGAAPGQLCIDPSLRGSGDLRVGTPEGVFALGGHVWEWTLDGYGPYSAGELTDPRGVQGVNDHVQRGASYLSPDAYAWRAAVRVGMEKDAKLPDVGFRCVWTGDRP